MNFFPYEIIDGNLGNPDPITDPYLPYEGVELTKSPFLVNLANGVVNPDPNMNMSTVFMKHVLNFRGAGVVLGAECYLRQCIIQNCYTGALMASSDSEMSDLKISNCRDVGIYIARDVGNGMTHRVHSYGHRVACMDEGGAWRRHDGNTFADSFLGYIGWANYTTITSTLFQHNLVGDCIFLAGTSELVNCTVMAQRETAEHNKIDVWGKTYGERKVSVILGNSCSMVGGSLQLTDWKHPVSTYSGRSSDGIRVDGDDVRIETNLIEWDGIDGARGIVLNGVRRNIKIDINTQGFHGLNDRILVIGSKCQGLDIVIRMEDMKKSIDQYIDIVPGWTGVVRIENTKTGAAYKFTNGSAH